MAAITHPLFALAACLLSCLLVGQSPAPGRDWFVRAGASGGDGSHKAPFDDPWRALCRCEAGDRIHVAGGQYFGRLGRGLWTIPNERVQLLGGYDAEFTTRDPWRRPTELCWRSTSKNWPLYARLSSDRPDVVVDGLVIDMQGQNSYENEQRLGRTGQLGESAMYFTQPATVRNCVILNPGCFAIDCRVGAVIENNLVVNALVWSIVVSGVPAGLERTTATIRGNTVMFAWDTEKPGAGGYGGAAIALRGPAVVADNVLAHCDNAAIWSVVDPSRLSITGNVFWQNRFANLSAEIKGQRAVVNDREMEMMEDVGLTRYEGNVVADPAIAIDDKVFTTGLAPACSLQLALGMLRPADTTAKAGARLRTLPAARFDSAPPAAPKHYQGAALTSWNRQPGTMDGKAIEMLIAVGGVANIQSMPAEYAKDKIAGVALYDPDGSGEMVTGFYAIGSTADRVCADASGWYRGLGKPTRLHLVRGIARAVDGVPKAAFFVETIERYEPPAAAAPPRPQGRDWFVRAGASGGDGSRDKPFRDPFQALERCQAGDAIHVAAGEYNGKLKAGRWTIGMPSVALLGGYDPSFTTRDPWRQPTRLQCAADFQGRRIGYTIEGTDDHSFCVVDGFVFDKRGDNVYDQAGSLNVGNSDKIEHVWLSRPGCALRNCVFVNGASGALRMAGGQSISNSVFVNHVLQTVSVEPGHATDAFEFRDNTVLFVWANHVGEGHGASGSLLRIGGQTHAVVQRNVFAYADNDAIRIETDPQDVALLDNLFAHNLWSNVQHMPTGDTVDDALMAQLADVGLRRCEGNRIGEPSLPIEAAWLAQHQAVRDPGAADKPPPPPAKPAAFDPFSDHAGARTPEPASTSRAADPFGEAGGKPADGAITGSFAPAYDWQAALKLAIAGGEIGARRCELQVVFAGVARSEMTYDYAATTWQVALRADSWAALDGTRVQLEGAIQRADRAYQLDDIREQDFACYLFSSPDGIGLPLRCYVRRGSKVERVCQQAQGFGTSKPTELHLLRGIARERRQLVLESAEKTR